MSDGPHWTSTFKLTNKLSNYQRNSEIEYMFNPWWCGVKSILQSSYPILVGWIMKCKREIQAYHFQMLGKIKTSEFLFGDSLIYVTYHNGMRWILMVHNISSNLVALLFPRDSVKLNLIQLWQKMVFTFNLNMILQLMNHMVFRKAFMCIFTWLGCWLNQLEFGFCLRTMNTEKCMMYI